MQTLLAHSGRDELDVLPQPFWDHVSSVAAAAARRARAAAAFWDGDRRAFCADVEAAGWWHDCGKLCPDNQRVLHGVRRERLSVDHTDAGTAFLMSQGREAAAVLVRSHHLGLPSVPEERLRVTESPPGVPFRNRETLASTAENWPVYEEHYAGVAVPLSEKPVRLTEWSALTYRLALSCLVDADHTDTAQHYGNAVPASAPEPRWRERLSALDAYVAGLGGRAAEHTRSRQRCEVYRACRDADVSPALRSCEAPVGSGKTTALMAHLLGVAIERNLRHILVVLPYTNIIEQAVDVYRKSLVLPGEPPEQVIAELHHLAEFDSLESRHLAALWGAPITVTTAVQFFETLASNQPARLRKLHELPGTAVFVDEAHAAIPSWLWPQTWYWLKELTSRWSCHFVLGSGSLARFWAVKDVIDPPERIPDLLPAEVSAKLAQSETRRVAFRRCEEILNVEDLCSFIQELPGPRLAILNTVQNAAALARRLRKNGSDVLHLSTALAPGDRARIVGQVRDRLRHLSDKNWCLVATSCVEAGVDFSFRSAIRESCSVSSLIQTGGRANREALWEASEVWDVRLSDSEFNTHPAFDCSRAILADLFEHGAIDRSTPAELVTEALRLEILMRYRVEAAELKKHEARLDFPKVVDLYKVIDTETRTVVVAPDLIRSLDARERVSSRDILRGSVQMWRRKLDQFAVTEFTHLPGLYKWTAPYDPNFLGYMAGVEPAEAGGYFV